MRPDVVAVKGNELGKARYIALEVKPDYPHEGESKGLRGIIKQVKAYYDSGYFDEFYIASSKGGASKLAEWSGKSIEQAVMTGPKDVELKEMPIPDFGVYSIEGTNCTNYSIQCVKPSPSLKRRKQPQFSLSEADYTQLLFEHFRCERKENVIPEAIIPDTIIADTSVFNRIDFMILNGDSDARAVFKNKHDPAYSITGIEVKYNIPNALALKIQLEKYQNSGCLSFLYLAIPDRLQDNQNVKQVFSELPDVGLIAISQKGEVMEKKPVKRLELKYDSVKFNQITSLIGDGSKVSTSFSPFYPDKKEQLCDSLHALPTGEKEKKKNTIIETTYWTTESCKEAIDALYCMFGSKTSYRCIYDYKRKGYVVEKSGL